MKKIVAILALLAAIAGGIWTMQSTKQITLQWDQMPAGEVWQAVRIYDLAGAQPVLLGTVPCSAGPPVNCPNSITLVVEKRAYTFVARSWDGTWESADSNSVVLAGPPKAPTNLRK